MDKQEYINLLELRNQQCSCPGLKKLFGEENKASELEAKCDFMRANVDLDEPKPEDRGFLQKYRQAVEQFHEQAGNYTDELIELGKRGLVNFRLHDLNRQSRGRRLSYNEFAALSCSVEEYAVTVNCSSCGQQIDSFSNLPGIS
jgi:hypothetical protein